MKVFAGSADTLMSQKFLDVANIYPVFEQMCSKTVSECMNGNLLLNSDLAFCIPENQLQ